VAGGKERLLRGRIRSIQSTKKITRAFELIAASRIVRAQQAIAAARPYVEKMGEVVTHLSRTPEARNHPIFRTPEAVNRVAVIAIAGDRGLSGAYNSSILRATERRMQEHRRAGREVMLVTVGKKVGSYFRYRNVELAEAFAGMSDRPGVDDARAVVSPVTRAFTEGEVDQIDVIYTDFISLGRQQVRVRTLVPIEPEAAGPEAADPATAAGSGAAGEATPSGRPEGFVVDYEYEPEPAELLDRLLPSWMQGEILAALLSASASEYAARQRAMKAATDNADDLITTLTRVMNRARQESITTEIMEIVGGAEALRAGGAERDHHDTYVDPDAA
jgi:F-type H+-transporting ATPase subunit gamma